MRVASSGSNTAYEPAIRARWKAGGTVQTALVPKLRIREHVQMFSGLRHHLFSRPQIEKRVLGRGEDAVGSGLDVAAAQRRAGPPELVRGAAGGPVRDAGRRGAREDPGPQRQALQPSDHGVTVLKPWAHRLWTMDSRKLEGSSWKAGETGYQKVGGARPLLLRANGREGSHCI